MHRTATRIPVLAVVALLTAATATAAAAGTGGPPAHRTAGRGTARPAVPATATPATVTPAQVAAVPPAATATPAGPPVEPLTGPGVYVSIEDADSTAVYVLRPGATTWTLVRRVPLTATPRDLPAYLLAPSGLLAAGWNENRVSVAPAVTPAGAPPARVVVAAVSGGHLCQVRWNGASTRLLYAAFTKDYKHAKLYTVGVDGTGRHALTTATDPGVCGATWSPSGATVAYVRTYAAHLPIAEYHEAMVLAGGHTREAHLRLSDKVHLDSVLAIAPDGRHALVGTKTVQPDGDCGDGGPDGFAVVDFATGAAYPIKMRGPGYAAQVFAFDTAGHLIADAQTSGADGGTTDFLELFDDRGRYLRTLPKFVGTGRSGLSLLAAVAPPAS